MSRGRKYPGLVYSLILIMVLAACNMPAPGSQPRADAPATTQTAQAVDAILQTQFAPTFTPQQPTQPVAQASITPGEIVPPPAQAATLTPTATTTPEIEFCSDKATFVKDITVEDGTIFSPGASFTKTWRLRNVGECIWTPQYKLVFVGGQPMNAPNEIPFTGYVNPNETVDLSITMTAPAANGAYQGEWMIRSADDQLFGIGSQADKAFWVKITVGEVSGDLNLGSPTWSDTFKNSSNWYLLDTSNTRFTVKNGQLIMEAFNPGKAEEWGLATHSAIKDFTLEATFKTGGQCSGKDRYGVLVRAPDPNKGVVFGFSCDGRYRLYKWDGANYTAIQEWKSAGQIVSGPNQTNRLSIQAVGSTLKLYANGKLLGEYSDATYQKGRFGLFIGSADTANLVVMVEDIAYWLHGE